ncbi:hypothetical protein [Paraburkholderia sp. SIMBA_054]|uniref:hypothetical protein n=1 Tax=Paraburkholderia sp. SIMBA_054 TaxID=3085795 RepID=UPI0039793673
MQAELDTVNLKIEVIKAGARRQMIREIREKMSEFGITTTALRKRLNEDPFHDPGRH